MNIKAVYLLLFSCVILITGCAPSPISEPASITQSSPTEKNLSSGDFKKSWDIYNNEYNSTGGILTIRKQGSTYTQTLNYSDGSCGTTNLTVLSEGEEIKLTDRPGNSFGDYMIISSEGRLSFYDKQGLIYGVSVLGTDQEVITECEQPQAEQGKELIVSMETISVIPIGDEQVTITLGTNLPDGMELMADLKGSGDYWSQDTLTVSNGKLTTTFGKVTPGTYKLKITSPTVSIQPEKIKALLGENGKNMTGNLIIFDQEWGGYFLEFLSEIEIK